MKILSNVHQSSNDTVKIFKKIIMKIILLIFLPFFAFAQQPDVVNPILVQDLDFTLVRPKVGKPYKVLLRNNHALLAEGIPDSTWVTICYGCGVQKIDTIDSEQLVYTDWTKHGPISDPVKVPGWHENTISYSTTGEAKYTFNGTGVEIWAERLESHGTGSVTVGTQTKTVSWAGSKQLPAKIAEFKGLPQGQHTVTIKPVSGVILLDFLVITR